MSRLSLSIVIGLAGLLAGASAHAQDKRGQTPAPPPPGINDPGVNAAAADTAPASSSTTGLVGMPELPAMGEKGHGTGRDGLNEPPPTMDVRSVGKDKVEEYRINGRLYMIHVIPAHGIPQTYMVNPQGELMRQPGQPPVSPVYYTIYKWGGTKKKDEGGNGK